MKNSIKKLVLFVAIMIVAACTPAQAQTYLPHQFSTNELQQMYVGDITVGTQKLRANIMMYRFSTEINVFDEQGAENKFRSVSVTPIVVPWCWDTNGNRQGDVAEDLNGDLLLDSRDCTTNTFQYSFVDGTANIKLTLTFTNGYGTGTFASHVYGILTPTTGTATFMSTQRMAR